MAKRNYVNTLTAKTFDEIVRGDGELYEVFLKPKKGYKVKRYIVTGGIKNSYGRKSLELKTYNVFGDIICGDGGWWQQRLEIDLGRNERNEKLNSTKLEFHLGDLYVSKKNAYDDAIETLRRKKLEINKEIVSLQKDLYSTE
jgi:hypothetical protein